MDRATKETVVGQIKEHFTDVMSVILCDYRGVDVPTVTEMRHEFREATTRSSARSRGAGWGS